MKLQYKITLFMTIILFLVIGGIGILTFEQVQKTVTIQMENNAMDLASTIATMDVVKESLGDTKDISMVQSTIENIRKRTRFQYIIVMDMDGIKYSYPIEYSLGKKYISGGEERVLEHGESYVSEDKNVLISAIRAFVPVYYRGKQVGAVVVGLLNNTVYEEVGPHIFLFKLTLVFGLFIGVIGAAILSYNIKKTIFGLEPHEIGLLLGQRDNILHGLKYGIVAVNQLGELILFNKVAQVVLGFEDHDIGKNIDQLKFNYTQKISEVLLNKKSVYNQEIRISPTITIMCSHTLLKNHKSEIIGVVSSFQDLTEVKQMAEELTGIKKILNDLRAQNHEFLNKLHTISGLIQLEEYDKAVTYISDIANQRIEILETLKYKIKEPHITGILLAKYNKAMEAKIGLEIDPSSNLDQIPARISVDEICSVIGNLIENAIDELIKVENGKILVKLSSDEDRLNIRIEDNGPGIEEAMRQKIYEKGFTTKKGNRGLGLNIVREIIEEAGGEIKLGEGNGTVWDIHIPMEKGMTYD